MDVWSIDVAPARRGVNVAQYEQMPLMLLYRVPCIADQ